MTDIAAPTPTDFLHDMLAVLGDIRDDMQAVRTVAETQPSPTPQASAVVLAARIRQILEVTEKVAKTAREISSDRAAAKTVEVHALREQFAALADELDPPAGDHPEAR